MDQELQDLTRQLTKNFEAQEKLLGLFGGMVKPGGKGGFRGHGDDDKPEGWFKKAKDSINAASETVSRWDYKTGRAADSVAGKFSVLSKDVGAASDAFQNLAKGLFGAAIGGALIGGLTRYTTGLTTTYKDLAEHGSTFAGGMLEMAEAAMDAKMGMEEYARFAKKNASSMALMGTKNGGLAGLTAQVRDNARQFGQFGYTVEGLNDLVGEYAETMRLQGRLDKLDHAQARQDLTDLAGQTSALSAAMGKSRKEITATAQEALRSTGITARLSTLTEAQAKKLGDSVGVATTQLAGQLGEAGKLLPQMLTDSVAYNGRAFNTELGQVFNAILPQGSSLMQGLSTALAGASKEDAPKLVNQFLGNLRDIIDQNADNLLAQQEAGDENARKVLALRQGIVVKTEEELAMFAKRVEQQEAFTKLMGNLEHNWLSFSTGLLKTVYPAIKEPLKRIGEAFERFGSSGGATAFADVVGRLTTRLAKFIEGFTDEENMKKFGDAVEGALNNLLGFIGAIAGDPQGDAQALDGFRKAGKEVGSINWSAVGGAITTVSGAIQWFGQNLQSLAVGIGGLLATVVAFKVGMAAIKTVNWLKNLGEMSIKAQKVIIHGSDIDFGGRGRDRRGGGDGGSDRNGRGRGSEHGERGRGGRRGWLSKFGKFGSALALGGGVLAGGATDVLADAMDNVSSHMEAQRDGTRKANDTVKEQAKAINEHATEAERVKPVDPKAADKPKEAKAEGEKAKPVEAEKADKAKPKPVETPEPEKAKPVEPKDAKAPKAEPAKAAPVDAPKADVPEKAAPKGGGQLMDRLGIRAIAKGAALVGTASQVVEGSVEALSSYQRWQKGEITGGGLTEELARNIAPRVAGVLGGIAGGIGGAALGSAVMPGVGTAAGGFMGGVAGSELFESWARTGTDTLIDAIKSVFPAPHPTPSNVQGNRINEATAANLSERITRDILHNEVELTERFKDYERRKDTDEEAKKMFNALMEVAKTVREGTEVNAQATQAVIDALRYGNRSVLNGLSAIGG